MSEVALIAVCETRVVTDLDANLSGKSLKCLCCQVYNGPRLHERVADIDEGERQYLMRLQQPVRCQANE